MSGFWVSPTEGQSSKDVAKICPDLVINLLKVSALTMQLKECLDFVFNLLKVSVLTMQSKDVWILCLTS